MLHAPGSPSGGHGVSAGGTPVLVQGACLLGSSFLLTAWLSFFPAWAMPAHTAGPQPRKLWARKIIYIFVSAQGPRSPAGSWGSAGCAGRSGPAPLFGSWPAVPAASTRHQTAGKTFWYGGSELLPQGRCGRRLPPARSTAGAGSGAGSPAAPTPKKAGRGFCLQRARCRMPQHCPSSSVRHMALRLRTDPRSSPAFPQPGGTAAEACAQPAHLARPHAPSPPCPDPPRLSPPRSLGRSSQPASPTRPPARPSHPQRRGAPKGPAPSLPLQPAPQRRNTPVRPSRDEVGRLPAPAVRQRGLLLTQDRRGAAGVYTKSTVPPR